MRSLYFIPFLSKKRTAKPGSGGHPPAPDAPGETSSRTTLRKIGLLAASAALCVGLSGCWEKTWNKKDAGAAQNLLRTPYYIFGPLEGTEKPAHPAVSRQIHTPAAPEEGEERLDNLQIVYALPDRPQRGSMVLHNMNLAHRIQKEPDLSYLLLQDPGDGSAMQLRYIPSMAVRGQGSSLYVPAARPSDSPLLSAYPFKNDKKNVAILSLPVIYLKINFLKVTFYTIIIYVLLVEESIIVWLLCMHFLREFVEEIIF